MEIKVINAGNCMMCGSEIKIVTKKDDYELPNIFFCPRCKEKMNDYNIRTLIDNLETAKIYAGAEMERLCNDNQHIDACVFQSIRDSMEQNMQLLQSYYVCKKGGGL